MKGTSRCSYFLIALDQLGEDVLGDVLGLVVVVDEAVDVAEDVVGEAD